MKWFLIIWLSGGCDNISNCTGFITTQAPSFRKLVMPSQEVCETIRDANKSAGVECWAQPDPKPHP